MRYTAAVHAGWLAVACALAGCNFRIDPVDLDGGGGAIDDSGFGFGGAVDLAALADGAPPGGGADLAHNGPFLSVTSSASPATVDLTAQGASDWAHWGYGTAGDFDHKAAGNGQISNFSSVGLNVPTQYGSGAISYRWSDGLNGNGRHPMVSATSTGIYVLGGGFKISAPADTRVRRLRLYVGMYDASGQLDASLSDNSAATYSDHPYTSSNNSPVDVEYVITYAAGAPGQTVTVQWTVFNSALGGNVTLQSATLDKP